MCQPYSLAESSFNWNPTLDCTRIDRGCQSCFQNPEELDTIRALRAGRDPSRQASSVPDALGLLHGTDPKGPIQVCAFGDLFHPDIETEYIVEVFDAMALCLQHTYYLTTKRAQRLMELAPRLHWTENMWVGVTAEDQSQMWRVEHLLATPAMNKFVSLSPLLGPVEIPGLAQLDLVIVGPSSCRADAPLPGGYLEDLEAACKAAGVEFRYDRPGAPVFEDKLLQDAS